MPRNWNLKRKFVTVFFILISLPTIFLGVLIYYQATDAFKKQAEENILSRFEKNQETLNSIIRDVESMSSYMIYDQDFRSFFKLPKYRVQEIRLAEEEIRGYFTFQLMSYDYIDSIELTSRGDRSFQTGNPVSGVQEEPFVEKAIEANGSPSWSGSYEVESDWGGKHSVVLMTRVINDLRNISEPIGLAKIRLDTKKVFRRVEVDPSQQGDYFILSNQGDVILHKDPSIVGKRFPDRELLDAILKSDEHTVRYKKDGNVFLIVKREVKNTNWLSVAMVNQDIVVGNLYNVRNLILFMILLLALLGGIAFIGFYLRLVKPIVELTGQTEQLEKGNFSAKVKVGSQDEIGILGMRFNQMVSKIQKYIDIEYRLKIKQKESELKALQNQIDPHFLYNTLDLIRWTARMEKAYETGGLIEKLSRIFRMNLNMGKMWVSVEKEMIYLQNYLELQRSRMGEHRLQFAIYYDYEIKDAYLMKQILQPIVENSIAHGFRNLPRKGKITIRCYRREQEVWIDVIDNGWGFPEQEEAAENNQTGYALNNLKERIEIAFGESFGIEQEASREGAWIRVKLPVLCESDIEAISDKSGEE
ncbi:sensor histidine kinase [Bacillus infantis]|uniref:sensor histidine kinase n=1 Tax=Bacillus infantis TaxID=324767 RepID=UPI003CEA5361